MLSTGLLLVIRLGGVVDRVEGAWAVVEWSDGTTTDVNTEVFPRAPHEGEVFQLQLRPRWEGPHLALPGNQPRLTSTEGLLDLPWSTSLRPGHRYTACIRLSGETDCWSPYNPSPRGQTKWKPRRRKPRQTPGQGPSKAPFSSSSDSMEREQ